MRKRKRRELLPDLILVIGMVLIPAGITLGGMIPLAVTVAGVELVFTAILCAATQDDEEGCG